MIMRYDIEHFVYLNGLFPNACISYHGNGFKNLFYDKIQQILINSFLSCWRKK